MRKKSKRIYRKRSLKYWGNTGLTTSTQDTCLSSLPESVTWTVPTVPEKKRKRRKICPSKHLKELSKKPQDHGVSVYICLENRLSIQDLLTQLNLLNPRTGKISHYLQLMALGPTKSYFRLDLTN